MQTRPAPDDSETSPESQYRPWTPILLAIVIFSTLSLYEAVVSKGFLEADGITHYLKARFALQQHYYFVDIWGRPLFTMLYAIPSTLAGRLGARLTSLVMAVLCALIAYRVAVLQRYRWPVLALICTLGSPLLFLHSFSELTELPFATLLIAAFWAFRKKFLIMAILLSLGPLSRPEGFGFLVVAAVVLVLYRRFIWLFLLPIPLLIWDVTGWVMYGCDGPWYSWLKHQWPYAGNSLYPSGPIWHFLLLMPMVTSPLFFPAMWLGAWKSAQSPFQPVRPNEPVDESHRRLCQLLIALLPLGILAGHSTLYALGKMASSGELRYMLVVSPFWALLAAGGWEYAFVRFNWRRPVLWAGLAALTPIVANYYWRVLPLSEGSDGAAAARVADWYRASPLFKRDYTHLLASDPNIFYHLDFGINDKGRTWSWKKETFHQLPHGTVVIWDPIYGVSNSDRDLSIPLDEVRADGWIEDAALENQLFDGFSDSPKDAKDRWRIFFSPRSEYGESTRQLLNIPLTTTRFAPTAAQP